MPDMETTSLPVRDMEPFKKKKVAEKAGAGGAIGAIAATAGLIIAGSIAANNPDKVSPPAQQLIAGTITAIVAGILSGTLNCIKNWWRRRANKGKGK